MTEQHFIARDHSPAPDYYLPPDDEDLDEDDRQWQDYCAEARHVDRQHVLDAVLSSLDANESPLFEFIDEALQEPHEPGRARDSITKLARLGKSIFDVIAKSVDDQVNLRMVIGGAR